MRVAVFSDVHGNLESLEAMIDNAADRCVDLYICLGDIVGYGANPNDCFERLEALPNLHCLLGNHDAAAIWQASPYEMSANASKAILWTMDHLSASNAERIKALETVIQLEDMLFCHANPYNPSGWRYVMGWYQALRSFIATRCRITFVGHTHRPAVFCRRNALNIDMSDPPDSGIFELETDCRYIFNPGAVGQPRDGNPDGGYLIFDARTQCVEFVRYAYDIENAARRIVDAGLPRHLAERLFKGR